METTFSCVPKLKQSTRTIQLQQICRPQRMAMRSSKSELMVRFPKKTWGFPSRFTIKSSKVLMATPQGRRLGYHTPEQDSSKEPPDSRPCILTTTLLGGVLKSSNTNPPRRALVGGPPCRLAGTRIGEGRRPHGVGINCIVIPMGSLAQSILRALTPCLERAQRNPTPPRPPAHPRAGRAAAGVDGCTMIGRSAGHA